VFPFFVSETVLQNSIFKIFTKRYRPSLMFILPIITTLHKSLIFQGIRPDTHCIPKYEYFMVRNFCTKCFARHITFAEIQKNVYIAVAQLLEALDYKPEGRGFDSRWSRWD
jgi:hypothetical protein